jgi:hypothetical protein
MVSKRIFVDNNCYATRIIGEPERRGFLYLALTKDNKENLNITWVKENMNSTLGVSLFDETPIIVREILQRFMPGDIIKIGQKRMKAYILVNYGEFFLLERIKLKERERI